MLSAPVFQAVVFGPPRHGKTTLVKRLVRATAGEVEPVRQDGMLTALQAAGVPLPRPTRSLWADQADEFIDQCADRDDVLLRSMRGYAKLLALDGIPTACETTARPRMSLAFIPHEPGVASACLVSTGLDEEGEAERLLRMCEEDESCWLRSFGSDDIAAYAAINVERNRIMADDARRAGVPVFDLSEGGEFRWEAQDEALAYLLGRFHSMSDGE